MEENVIQQKHYMSWSVVNFFSDEIFEKLRKYLDIEMKISAHKKLGLKPRQAVVVSEEIENFLWDKSFLGCSFENNLLFNWIKFWYEGRGRA